MGINSAPNSDITNNLHPLAEAWVLSCHPDDPGAYLYYGFKDEISLNEFAQRIRNNTLLDVLHAVPVHKGDCFFIPSGTLHAICKGIVVAEVQQNSNVTYRVYDYNRVGTDGKQRELHVEKALEVTQLKPSEPTTFNGHLAQCTYFTVDAVCGGYCGFAGEMSFVSLLITDGQGTLLCSDESLTVIKGESYFLPANSGRYALSDTVKALVTTL